MPTSSRYVQTAPGALRQARYHGGQRRRGSEFGVRREIREIMITRLHNAASFEASAAVSRSFRSFESARRSSAECAICSSGGGLQSGAFFGRPAAYP